MSVFLKNNPLTGKWKGWMIVSSLGSGLVILLATAIIFGNEVKTVSYSTSPKRIVLIGASIGKGWNIERFPERMKKRDYLFEYVGSGTFDKSAQLKDILGRRENRADAVILKECAAYFPGDAEVYQNSLKRWVQECRNNGVIPIPATVVPVTRLHAVKKFMIDIVKLRNPFKSGGPFRERRLSAILSYNDWVRDFSRQEGLLLLDLEAALCYGPDNRRLQSKWARYDGLHLKPNAYQALDKTLIVLLDKIDWRQEDNPSARPGN